MSVPMTQFIDHHLVTGGVLRIAIVTETQNVTASATLLMPTTNVGTWLKPHGETRAERLARRSREAVAELARAERHRRHRDPNRGLRLHPLPKMRAIR